jgi:hypothetical protein
MSQRSLQRHALSLLGWLMASSLILPVLAAIVWLLSNLRDVPAAPRPSELALPAPTLPASRNTFFALAGVFAPLSQEPAAAAVARDAASDGGLRLPTTAPWRCADSADNCTAYWLEQAPALAVQRAAQAWGTRCDALFAAGATGGFEEVLPQPLRVGSPLAQHASGSLACQQWFLTGAVLAFAQGERANTVNALAMAQRQTVALLNGSRTLLAHRVALRQARRFLNAVAALAARDASLAPELMPMLQSWPAQSDLARRWLVTEAEYHRVAMADMLQACAQPLEPTPGEPDPSALVGGADAISAWLCRHRIGTHPERTQQMADQLFQQRLARVQGDWPAALQQLDEPYKPTLGFEWINSLGAFTVNLSRSTGGGDLGPQGDLELVHYAVQLVLAVQQQAIPLDQRAAWLARQTQAPYLAKRLSWSANGEVLTGELFSTRETVRERDAIRFVVPHR